MAILVNCRCGQTYSVRDEFAGQPVQCAVCSQVVFVPAVPPPSPGPRLRPQPGSSAPARPGVPLAAFGFLVVMCLACVLFVVNFDRIVGLFNSSSEQRAE